MKRIINCLFLDVRKHVCTKERMLLELHTEVFVDEMMCLGFAPK